MYVINKTVFDLHSLYTFADIDQERSNPIVISITWLIEGPLHFRPTYILNDNPPLHLWLRNVRA